MQRRNFIVAALVITFTTVIRAGDVLRNLGCWKDESERAIPYVGDYSESTNPIQDCANKAKTFGYSVFAVQNGGQCFTGNKAMATYKKYGVANNCNSDGRGGGWANQVYQIVAYDDLGCWKDKSERAIPSVADYTRSSNPIGECAKKAKEMGNMVFAVQFGGQCYTGKSAMQTYNKYGASDNCNSNGKGGGWANQVYKLVDPTALHDLGCWKDESTRAMPSAADYTERANPVQDCANSAKRIGSNIFGVQFGGQCFTGKLAMDTYKKYGAAANCNSDGRGGSWANQVYEIIYEDVLHNLGCWKDTGTRAIPFVADYTRRSNPIQDCAKKAKALGSAVFAVQREGQCYTGKSSMSTYKKYGPKGNCRSNGLGGTWANQVYQILSYDDLGCWKDKEARAIPYVVDYSGRANPVGECAKRSKVMGNTVFAVQYGGQCLTGKSAKQTYKKYGSADNCNRKGTGGGWANQVYELVPSRTQTTTTPTIASPQNCGIQKISPKFQKQPFAIRKGQLIPIRRIASRVLGGDVAVHGSWPWSAELRRSADRHCGAVLIRKNLLLTAAHCLENSLGLKLSDLSIKMGHSNGSESHMQNRKMKQFILHSGYISATLENDIALVVPKTPFVLNEYANTACLPDPGYIVPAESYCVATGWGNTGDTLRQYELKQVVLPVHSHTVCVKELGSQLEDETQMCAGRTGYPHDTCTGDSGGPLVCLKGSRWIVQGLTSAGYTCETKQGSYAIYTRVSKHMDWIEQQIKLLP